MGSLTSLQRSTRSILQLQPTGQSLSLNKTQWRNGRKISLSPPPRKTSSGSINNSLLYLLRLIFYLLSIVSKLKLRKLLRKRISVKFIRIFSNSDSPSNKNRTGSDGNEGVFGIPQSSCLTGVSPSDWRGCPRGVMVKAMDCGIVVSEFVLQSRYYVHFRANTLGKGMNPLILPAMG